MKTLKRLVARLPLRLQQELKRHHHGWLRTTGRFVVDDPEFDLLTDLVKAGDWVVDVGANVGHYTLRLAELVDRKGRVLAFEPVPETLELLAAAVARSGRRNVTILGVAASHALSVAGMDIPLSKSGLRNFYQARLTSNGSFEVLSLPIDQLDLLSPVSLVKIDAEGHDLAVLQGMRRLLERDRPVLIVESRGDEIEDFLAPVGYRGYSVAGSPNRLYDCGSNVEDAVRRRGLRLASDVES